MCALLSRAPRADCVPRPPWAACARSCNNALKYIALFLNANALSHRRTTTTTDTAVASLVQRLSSMVLNN